MESAASRLIPRFPKQKMNKIDRVWNPSTFISTSIQHFANENYLHEWIHNKFEYVYTKIAHKYVHFYLFA